MSLAGTCFPLRKQDRIIEGAGKIWVLFFWGKQDAQTPKQHLAKTF
jgi:hypothetical protein